MSWRSSTLDTQIEKATDESIPTGEEDIALNLEICDLIRSKTVNPKDAMRALKRRINNKNPNVQLHAIHLTDIVAKNSGYHFLLEISSREFIDNLLSILCVPSALLAFSSSIGTTTDNSTSDTITNSTNNNNNNNNTNNVNPDVQNAILSLIQTWALAFKNQPQLAYVERAYKILKNDTHFSSLFPDSNNISALPSDAYVNSLSPPEWADSDLCMLCRTPFSFTNRKHHCRNCGNVFDNQCSSHFIPLPDLGILNPVRVCDSCFSLKQNKQSQNKNIQKNVDTKNKKNETKNKKIPNDDLQRAIQLSLQEVSKNEPQPKSIPDDDDDPDLKAAIEASIREMKVKNLNTESETTTAQPTTETLSNSTNTINNTNAINATNSSSTFVSKAPPSNDLSPTEKENINLFAVLVEKLNSAPTGTVLREKHLQGLADNITFLRPKLAKSLAETISNYDTFVKMLSQLTAATKLYDKILEESLASAYSNHYVSSPAYFNNNPPINSIPQHQTIPHDPYVTTSLPNPSHSSYPYNNVQNNYANVSYPSTTSVPSAQYSPHSQNPHRDISQSSIQYSMNQSSAPPLHPSAPPLNLSNPINAPQAQSLDQPQTQTVNQSQSQPVTQPQTHSLNQPADQLTDQLTSQSTSQSPNQIATQLTGQSTGQLTNQSNTPVSVMPSAPPGPINSSAISSPFPDLNNQPLNDSRKPSLSSYDPNNLVPSAPEYPEDKSTVNINQLPHHNVENNGIPQTSISSHPTYPSQPYDLPERSQQYPVSLEPENSENQSNCTEKSSYNNSFNSTPSFHSPTFANGNLQPQPLNIINNTQPYGNPQQSPQPNLQPKPQAPEVSLIDL